MTIVYFVLDIFRESWLKLNLNFRTAIWNENSFKIHLKRGKISKMFQGEPTETIHRAENTHTSLEKWSPAARPPSSGKLRTYKTFISGPRSQFYFWYLLRNISTFVVIFAYFRSIKRVTDMIWKRGNDEAIYLFPLKWCTFSYSRAVGLHLVIRNHHL